MSAAAAGEAFAGSRERFETIVGWLDGDDAAGLTHSELEAQLDARGRELLRGLFQDHLAVRARDEPRLAKVVDDAGVGRGAVEAGHRRALGTIFGQVEVERLAYRAKGHANLYPADATLNLPAGRHSHGLRRLAAIEASRGSFDAAVDAVERAGASSWANVRSKVSRRPASSTSRRSTATVSLRPAIPMTCWCSPVTAKGS